MASSFLLFLIGDPALCRDHLFTSLLRKSCMKFAQTITVLIAGSVVGVAAMQIQPAQAAILNYDFSVAIDSASSFLPGVKGSGSFSVDDSSFDALGSAVLTQLNFKFDNISGLYTAKDDVDYPFYPVVFQATSFGSGSPVGLNFEFLNKNSTYSSPEDIAIVGDSISIYENGSSDNQIGFGSVSYAAAGVPEPSSISGMLLAGGVGVFLLKRKMTATLSRKLK